MDCGSKVDPVVLNTADPLLLFEVAIKGMLVYERQQGLASIFKLKAIKMHMDAAKFFALDRHERLAPSAGLRNRFENFLESKNPQ